MNWNKLTSVEQLSSIRQSSQTKPQVIFKHSTRCSISSTAWRRLEKGKLKEEADFYYLDLIAHRDVSNTIADVFRVVHESPQVLVIKNEACIYNESHLGITVDELNTYLSFI
jgi:bacillithiol system protein YtxJ